MMSGSSLDGLDLALCRIRLDAAQEEKVTAWEILAAETAPFSRSWRERLSLAPQLPGKELWQLHTDFGHWIGQRAAGFLARHPAQRPTLVGSHGHTVFHYPAQQFTCQIGDGAAIAYRLGLPTVTELRSSDVAAGGQGAPLAPLADRYLYPEYGGFLNLGGIANLSFKTSSGAFVAGDISGCCQVLDRLAAREGLPYDAGGQLAAQGMPAPAIAQKIAALPYHQLPYPKSLGNDWVRDQLWPVLDDASLPTADLLYTFTCWLAHKIAYDLAHLLATTGTEKSGAHAGASQGKDSNAPPINVLLTGGGAHNHHLVKQLRATQDVENPAFNFVVSDAATTDFKEAALIALAALFRREGLPNALPSATGASRATSNGAIYLPPPDSAIL